MRHSAALKYILISLVTTTVHLAALHLGTYGQVSSGLFWPCLALRGVSLLLASPALGLQGLIDLKLGLPLPLPLLLFGLHLTYPFLGSKAKNLWKVLRSPTHRSRRNLFVGAGVLAVGATGVARETNQLVVRHFPLALKDLPEELEGLKIALVADIHRGPVVSLDFVRDLVARINAQNPDLVLLPGDFVSKSSRYFADITLAFKELKPTIGSFATLGNHDHWEGEENALRALQEAGVHTLHNQALYLSRSREISETAIDGLCLAGVDDLWTGNPDLAAALQNTPQTLPVILLSHNPDLAERQADCGKRVDVQFSGHTHGGQIVLPGLGPLATASAYGTKYLSGWAQGPNWKVFTTVGVGTSTFPVRVGATSEIVLFQTQTAETVTSC